MTDASTRFRFEGNQLAGEIVYAKVNLRASDTAPSKVLQIEGALPFESEVTPPLPAGLRVEVHYKPWFLEGVPHEPVDYLFKIQLLGEPAALKRVKAVDYRLSPESSKGARITRRLENEYFLEGSMPSKEDAAIIAVIEWVNGKSSTHTIPLRPRS
jgi:hypothetical protein